LTSLRMAVEHHKRNKSKGRMLPQDQHGGYGSDSSYRPGSVAHPIRQDSYDLRSTDSGVSTRQSTATAHSEVGEEGDV